MCVFNTNYFIPTSEIIKEHLDALNMTQKELAERLDVSEKHMSKLLNNQVQLTMDIAIGLERVFGLSVNTWMNYEIKYREFLARKNIIEKIEDLDMNKIEKDFQLSFLMKKGWIIKDRNTNLSLPEKINLLLNFLGVDNFTSFYNLYSRKILNYAFKEDGFKLESLAIWLRKCDKEIEKKGYLGSYSKTKFKENIKKIKKLLYRDDIEMFDEIETLCNNAGVHFIMVEAVPNSKVRGAVVWYGNNPAILLSLRYKTNDHFWFAFFHEVAHILLHLRKGKDLIECDNYYQNLNQNKEEEADNFAEEYILSEKAFTQFVNNNTINKQTIKYFSKEQEIHPGILVGRLQHMNYIDYSMYNEFKIRYSWK